MPWFRTFTSWYGTSQPTLIGAYSPTMKVILQSLALHPALNHPNFMLPNVDFNGSGAGLITATQPDGGVGGPRVFQAGLKLQF